ncbi:MAG: hypothetical protein ACREA9_13010 [Pyrinomonadaceae bacterium]
MRKWDSYDSPLHAEKIMFLLDLRSGIRIDVTVKDGNIALAPARLRFSLEQLLKEQKKLERKRSRRIDQAWLNGPKRGKELL